jgi:hypothetical protein
VANQQPQATAAKTRKGSLENASIAAKVDINWLTVGKKRKTNTNVPKDTVQVEQASKEAGGAAVDNGSKVEFLLCGFTTENLKSFPDNQALQNDPNIWIGDTGATTHRKKSDSGMVNIQKASESDAVTMGNKQVKATTKPFVTSMAMKSVGLD